MDFTEELTLDLNAGIAYTTIAAKQCDSARWIKIHLTKNNIPYALDTSHNFMFRMRKPDGHGIINPAVVQLHSNDSFIAVSENHIIEGETNIEESKYNFKEYIYYTKQGDTYTPLPRDVFFEEKGKVDYQSSYYVKEYETFRKATPGDQGKVFYEFISNSNPVYFWQNDINYSESTINIQLTEQVLAVAGRGYADIVEYDSDRNVLSSASFIINIMAQPNVAGNATSTDEFLKLEEVVATADDVLGEAETWTRGTNKGKIVSTPSYKIDSTITSATYSLYLKEFLYTGASDSLGVMRYTKVNPSAAFDSTVTYYYADASIHNNARHYAELAADARTAIENLGVAAVSVAPGGDPTVAKTTDGGVVTLTFGIPTGATGAQGPIGKSNCVASSAAPTDEDVVLWFNTTGKVSPILAGAEQILYDSAVEYPFYTVGSALQGVIRAESIANTALNTANSAFTSAGSAFTDAANALSIASSVSGDLAAANESFDTRITDLQNSLQSQINSKIALPTLYANYGILVAEKNSDIVDISWQYPLGYDILNSETTPKINNNHLTSNTSLNLIPANDHAVTASDLNSALTTAYNLANSAAQLIQVSGKVIPTSVYKAPYVADLTIDESAFATRWSSLYIPVVSSNGVLYTVASSSVFDSAIVYYTHDTTYEGYQYIDIGTVLTETNVINKNFLDNPWFIVNQRNFTSATVNSSSFGYLCDRWKVLECQGNQSRTINLNENGLNISASTTSNDPLEDFSIGQVLDENLGISFLYKTICLSIAYTKSAGSPLKYAFGSAICTEKGTPFFQVEDGSAWFFRLKKQNNKFIFEIACGQNMSGASLTDSDIIIRSAKLESGIFSTLEQDVAPAYLEELAKCQKYYYRCYGEKYSENAKVTVVGRGIAASAKQLDWTMELPYVTTSKTATIAATTDLIVRKGIEITANASTLTTSAIAESTKFSGANGIYLQTATSSLSVSANYYIMLPPGTSEHTDAYYIEIKEEL